MAPGNVMFTRSPMSVFSVELADNVQRQFGAERESHAAAEAMSSASMPNDQPSS